jgi:hypothetical protein
MNVGYKGGEVDRARLKIPDKIGIQLEEGEHEI